MGLLDPGDIPFGQDSGGLFGTITDKQFGTTPQVETSGFFGEEGQLRELGGLYADFLLDLMSQPIEESQEFGRGREVIRGATETAAKTSRQRLGDRAVTTGSLDSGAINENQLAIARQEMEAFTKGINELFFGLSQRRDNLVQPFLQGAVQEDLTVNLANLDAQTARDRLAFENKQVILDTAQGPFG